jgi:hypothetical protein
MAKGGCFELEIAKKLSLWLTNNKRDDLVCRTDTSGGRATVRTKQKKETNKYLYGDLKHSDDLAKLLFDKWSIECKTGYAKKSKLKDGTKKVINWDILDLLDSKSKSPVISEMLFQCTTDACLSRREPVLIFRRNQKLPCIVITLTYFLRLSKYFGLPKFLKIEADIPKMHEPNNRIVIIKFDDFLKWADSKVIKDLLI